MRWAKTIAQNIVFLLGLTLVSILTSKLASIIIDEHSQNIMVFALQIPLEKPLHRNNRRLFNNLHKNCLSRAGCLDGNQWTCYVVSPHIPVNMWQLFLIMKLNSVLEFSLALYFKSSICIIYAGQKTMIYFTYKKNLCLTNLWPTILASNAFFKRSFTAQPFIAPSFIALAFISLSLITSPSFCCHWTTWCQRTYACN